MTETLNIAIAQLNLTVGDIDGNAKKVLDSHARAESEGADIIVYSETVVTGYPPEDLINAPWFIAAAQAKVLEIAEATKASSTGMLITTPWEERGAVYNAILLVEGGKITAKQYKHDLPNYGVFDEKRVFTAGPLPSPMDFRGLKLGVMICEDMWNLKVIQALEKSDFLISSNASPFEVGKHEKRVHSAAMNVRAIQKPLIYVNQICGQDDLVFDGDSFVMSRDATLRVRLSRMEEDFCITKWHKEGDIWRSEQGRVEQYDCEEQVIYQAMMRGLRDYVEKNGFPGVVIGMSGGVDSALTAAIAVDALGADRVRLVMMPSRYTSQESVHDATECAENLGVKIETIPIEGAVEAFGSALSDTFADTERDLTEENLQSRIRGTLLMAISNKFGHMVVATGNKSEMSVGYATLYGDMCGGYSVLKDVYKHQVFALCRWRNGEIPESSRSEASGEVVPVNIITKEPTAELRENQKDVDSLPPYDVLDPILFELIEEQISPAAVIAKGFDEATVRRIYKLLQIAEYKRRQSPPGVKVSVRPFGRDRRYPITNKFAG